MYVNLGFVDSYANARATELLREADQDRLAQLAKGPGRPLRMRLADWLRATAERLEDVPARPVYESRVA
jgi:hypothetical protein